MQEKISVNAAVKETEIPRLMDKLSEAISSTLDAVAHLDVKLSNSVLRSPSPEGTQNAKETSPPITGLGELIHEKTGEVRKIHIIVTSIIDRLEI